MQRLGIAHPQTLVFNDVDAALAQWRDHWPALLKPEQGGSGARMYLLHSADELVRLLRDGPDLWLPDNLLMLQEYFEVGSMQGIVRMEFLGGECTIAVLPLENLGHEPANDYFSDGLTDELIRNLSVIDGLAVRSRTSSFAFKAKSRNVGSVMHPESHLDVR